MPDQDANRYTRTWSSDGEIDFVTLKDGTRLRYLKTGTGPKLVLLHTLRTQLDYFQRLIPLLKNRFTIYALDLPALGWSDIKPGASYEEPALRRAVAEFVTKLNLEDVTLVGESIGATLALTASTELPDRIRQVIALNTYDYPEGVERANLLANVIVKAMRIPVAGRLFSILANPPVLGGIIGGGFHDSKKLPKDFVLEQLRSGKRAGYSIADTDYFKALPSFVAAKEIYSRITVPVTLVYGDDDWSRAEDRAETAKRIPGNGRIMLNETGHFSALESPEEIARIVLKTAGSNDNAPARRSA
jgi:pimeloyl-ACP methyl ester carboxylesterase